MKNSLKATLRKWEHLEERRCLNCNKRFVTKVYVSQAGTLKGVWIVSSVYCSTKCSDKHRKLLRRYMD